MKFSSHKLGWIAALALAAAPALAKETPVGKPLAINGMEIGAVYLQPIEMEPPGMMRDAKESDVHLEADIKADKDIHKVYLLNQNYSHGQQVAKFAKED